MDISRYRTDPARFAVARFFEAWWARRYDIMLGTSAYSWRKTHGRDAKLELRKKFDRPTPKILRIYKPKEINKNEQTVLVDLRYPDDSRERVMVRVVLENEYQGYVWKSDNDRFWLVDPDSLD